MALIPSNSRFKRTPTIMVGGVETFGKWTTPRFMNKPAVGRYTVPAELAGRPDNIADQQLGSEEFAWALIAFNQPVNTLNWPAAGETIDIPDISTILTEF